MFQCGKVPAGKSAFCALLSLVLERHADAVLRERAACSLDRLTASPEAAKVRNCTSTIALVTAAESLYSTLGKNRFFTKVINPQSCPQCSRFSVLRWLKANRVWLAC